MTGLVFGTILVLAVVCWIVLAATHHRDEDSATRPLAMLFLAAAPLLLFGIIVVLTFRLAPAGEYRVALEAIELDLSDNDVVTVGGGADGDEADDLIVRDLPPRYLTFRLEGDHVAAMLPAELDHAIENPTYAAVRVDDAKPFANSVALTNVTSLQIETRNVAIPSLPPRVQNLPMNWSIPIARRLTAETVMYPLRFWTRPAKSTDVVTGSDGAPLGSFLSHDRGFLRRTLFATLVGDGTSVGAKRYERRIAEIRPGSPRRFALFRLDFDDPVENEKARNLAQERRSFRASFEKGRLALVFDTPDIVRLSAENVAPLVKKEEGRESFLLATRDPRRNSPVVANQMVLSFPQLGPRVQNELYSAIRVTRSGNCIVRVTSHMGTNCFASGDAFRVGDRAAAVVRVTEMTTPWGIILTLLALSFFSFAWMRRQDNDTLAIVIISAAELLLAVRLLIAFEGGLLDPASASGVWESLVAFALLPFTLRIAWGISRKRAAIRRLFPLVAVEAVAIMSLVGIALMRANIETEWIVAMCAAVVLVPVVFGFLAIFLIDRMTAATHSLRFLLLFAFGIAAVRVGMLGVGWKERISLFGADLALTVLYLPVVFLFFAFVWQRYREHALSSDAGLTKTRLAIGALLAFIGVTLTVLIPFIVKDSGSAFVHVPAVVLLFALPMLARIDRTSTLLALPLVGVLAVHVIVGLMPHLRGASEDPAQSVEYRNALTDEAGARKFMAKRLGQSANQLRVLSQVAPHQLEEAGTSRAEGLVMQRRMLDRYGGRGILGAGYLDVPLTTFRDTHLNDNLSAIHILAPFGIAGAIGVLALLVALALVPLKVHFSSFDEDDLESPERALDQRAALGVLALWTFSIAGIYMFAANLGLVLFTGKNVYLLAATSKSDALEGGILLLIALVTFVATPKRSEEPKPAQETAE